MNLIFERIKQRVGRKERCGIFKCPHCFNYFEATVSNVKLGKTKSCGCLYLKSRKEINKKHGLTYSIECRIWNGMKSRCNNLKDVRYGGRGITVCDRWLGENGFLNFLEDMGHRPSNLYSIERKDNDKGYSKENCMWATKKEQSLNRRSNIKIEYNGQCNALSEWAKELNLPYQTLLNRINKKWDIKDAFTTPVNLGNKNIGNSWERNSSKFILDTETGIFYGYLQEACDAKGLAKTTLGYMLRGVRKNKTSLIYV